MANLLSHESLPPQPDFVERQIISILRDLGQQYRAVKEQRVLPRAFTTPGVAGHQPVPGLDQFVRVRPPGCR